MELSRVIAMKKRVVALLVVVLAALLSGCWGYTSQDLFREDMRTVYVEFMDNSTFRRGIEVHLTRAVVAEIALRTPLTFAPREEADSVLSGTILDATERTVLKNEDDATLIERLALKVKFRDIRTLYFNFIRWLQNVISST